MTGRTVETIEIGQGIQYAKVSSRLAAFHEDNTECHIETSCEFKEGFALFSAKVTTKKGSFTGHSLAKVTSGKKAFEKQETIAVGRALAFAGYLSSGDIASQEEMTDFQQQPSGVTPQQLNELKKAWAKKYAETLETGADDDTNRRENLHLFKQWVQQTLGENFNLGGKLDVSQCAGWSTEEMEQCENAVKAAPDMRGAE